MIEFSKGEKYVTYLKEGLIFEKNSIVTDLENYSIQNKPTSAFWGSPMEGSYGWKEWCDCESFGNYDWNNPIIWKLKDNSKILRITWEDIKIDSLLFNYTKEDLFMKEVLKDLNRPVDLLLDFEKMLSDEIVAVELTEPRIGHTFFGLPEEYSKQLERMFCTWDCESIVVLDSSKIDFL